MDRLTIVEHEVPGFELMCRAGRSLFRQLMKHVPDAKRVSVFCGGGNNGGDGYIVAGLAKERGLDVELITLTEPALLTGDAFLAWQWARERQVSPVLWQGLKRQQPADIVVGDVVVDALLGTGLSGPVRDDYATAIGLINASNKPVIAVDVPSGLCSDTGKVLGVSIRADVTVTFIGVKQGLLTGQAPAYVGQLVFDSLNVPDQVYKTIEGSARRVDLAEMASVIPYRRPTDHKGRFGRVVLVGGNAGMGGAIILAAEAALRTGAGLVSVVTRAEHIAPMLARIPEVMPAPYLDEADLRWRLQHADAVVIGPGLGKDLWSKEVFGVVMDEAATRQIPMVCDADALNILAENGSTVAVGAAAAPWVLTPHPGEAARLLNMTTADIESDRFSAVRKLQQKYGGIAILKGAGSLIRSPVQVALATVGNPGMASGGMGDVLSGMLGSLCAQGVPLYDAACLAVCWHGESADKIALRKGFISLSATDVIAGLGEVISPYEMAACERRN